MVGGEIVTAGLKARARQVFGPVQFDEGYGMTEIWPLAGLRCPDGHLHFEPSRGWSRSWISRPGPGRPAGLARSWRRRSRRTVRRPCCSATTPSDVVAGSTTPRVCACATCRPPATARQAPPVGPARAGLDLPARRSWRRWRRSRTCLCRPAAGSGQSPAAWPSRSSPGPTPPNCGGRSSVASRSGGAGPSAGLVSDRRQLRRPLPLRCDLREATFDDARASGAVGDPTESSSVRRAVRRPPGGRTGYSQPLEVGSGV